MSIQIYNNSLQSAQYGSTPIAKIQLGSNEIWASSNLPRWLVADPQTLINQAKTVGDVGWTKEVIFVMPQYTQVTQVLVELKVIYISYADNYVSSSYTLSYQKNSATYGTLTFNGTFNTTGYSCHKTVLVYNISNGTFTTEENGYKNTQQMTVRTNIPYPNSLVSRPFIYDINSTIEYTLTDNT